MAGIFYELWFKKLNLHTKEEKLLAQILKNLDLPKGVCGVELLDHSELHYKTQYLCLIPLQPIIFDNTQTNNDIEGWPQLPTPNKDIFVDVGIPLWANWTRFQFEPAFESWGWTHAEAKVIGFKKCYDGDLF